MLNLMFIVSMSHNKQIYSTNKYNEQTNINTYRGAITAKKAATKVHTIDISLITIQKTR